MGTLFLVSTPIGNLSDISKRALETLTSSDYILCEDTRRSGQLLTYYSIQNSLVSYYEQNELVRIPKIINDLLAGKNISLITDSGTPTISDPGFKLVRMCKQKGISVVAIPGPSSITTALISSGLPTDSFFFIGYLPKKEGHLLKKLNQIKEITKIIPTTFCVFIPPHDLIKIINEFKTIFGNIQITLARELTKIHEDVRSQSIENWLQEFAKNQPRGEFTLLFHYSP